MIHLTCVMPERALTSCAQSEELSKSRPRAPFCSHRLARHGAFNHSSLSSSSSTSSPLTSPPSPFICPSLPFSSPPSSISVFPTSAWCLFLSSISVLLPLSPAFLLSLPLLLLRLLLLFGSPRPPPSQGSCSNSLLIHQPTFIIFSPSSSCLLPLIRLNTQRPWSRSDLPDGSPSLPLQSSFLFLLPTTTLLRHPPPRGRRLCLVCADSHSWTGELSDRRSQHSQPGIKDTAAYPASTLLHSPFLFFF